MRDCRSGDRAGAPVASAYPLLNRRCSVPTKSQRRPQKVGQTREEADDEVGHEQASRNDTDIETKEEPAVCAMMFRISGVKGEEGQGAVVPAKGDKGREQDRFAVPAEHLVDAFLSQPQTIELAGALRRMKPGDVVVEGGEVGDLVVLVTVEPSSLAHARRSP